MAWWKRSETKKIRNGETSTWRHPQLMPGQDNYIFRRSRTITGTSSSAINSTTVSQRPELQSPRQKLHELYSMRRQLIRMLSIVVGLVLLLSLLAINYIVSVDFVYPQAGTSQLATIDQSVYRLTAQHYFNDHPFERFGFMLNAGALSGYMQEQHSELASVILTKRWYGAINAVSLTFRRPIIVWQTGAQRYYVDSAGVAFLSNYFKDVKPVAVVDQSGISQNVGSSVASKRFVYFLGNLVGAINGSGVGEVSGVTIPASTREIDIKMSGVGYLFKTDIDNDPLKQAEDLLNAYKYFKDHNVNPEYVDVRVSGKAYYK